MRLLLRSPYAARPGTRASSSAPSRPCDRATSGRSGPSCRSRDRKRDLALFNLAIDSKLRGCDVVAVRVDDVAPSGYAMDRATIRQRKTGRPVRFELTDQTRMAIDEYLRLTGRKPGQFLFAGRGDGTRGLTTRQYARLVQEWVASIGLDPGEVWHPFAAPHEGGADLPADWEPQSGSTFARTFEDRKHRSLSRHRGR